MCQQFGVTGSPAIPADFFGPGSDPFSDTVCLEGVPLGPTTFGDFGSADTLIERMRDPFDRCDLPSDTLVTVPIEIVALSLKSVSSITVTFNGGQDPEQWDVAVDLSTFTPVAGELTAIKTHCNGGTYTSVLNVQPRFTFTRTVSPSGALVLDTGLEGIDPVTLVQDIPMPWVSDVDPLLGATTDLCSDFHAGIQDLNTTTACDCQPNGVRDLCDIETGVSLDCNANTIPDECDTIDNGDFDGDGTVDLDDYSAFADCMAGPDQEPQPLSPECINACRGAFDFNGDDDVDLIDFALYQTEFTGRL